MSEVVAQQSVILSICIPAYNKPKELQRLLTSISRQYSPQVEIVIGDDGNAEDTKKILSAFTHMSIVHIVNSPRKGYSRNLLAVSRKATGKYVWWAGDDDELEQGAVAHVLSVLEKEPAIMWVNVRSSIRTEPYGKNVLEGYMDSVDDVLEKVGPLLTFLSSIIFQKEMLSDVSAQELIDFEDSSFVNFIIVMRIMLTHGPLYYIAKPCVIAHWTLPGDSSWHKTFQMFGVEFLDIMNYFRSSISLRAYRAITGSMFSFFWKALLIERARVGISLYPVIIPLVKRYWSYPDVLIAVPLFLLPRFIIKVLYRAYCAAGFPGVIS